MKNNIKNSVDKFISETLQNSPFGVICWNGLVFDNEFEAMDAYLENHYGIDLSNCNSESFIFDKEYILREMSANGVDFIEVGKLLEYFNNDYQEAYEFLKDKDLIELGVK